MVVKYIGEGGSVRAAAFIVVCVALVIAFPDPSISRAQRANPPLILNMRGDLWTWADARLQQRTNWGYNNKPVLAPNGNQIAYKSTAKVAVDAIKRSGGIGGGDLPANIWVLDIATNDALRVVDQPPDASLLAPPMPDKYVVRSEPTWSPDANAIAWTELVQDTNVNREGTLRLVAYDLQKKATRILVPALPQQYGVSGAAQVVWGEPGLAVRSTVPATDAKGFAVGEDSILVFDADGKLLTTAKIGLLSEFVWIKDRGQAYVAALSNGPVDTPGDPQWLLIDPHSGRIAGMTGVPELYSLSSPDGVSLVPTITGTSPDWQIAEPGKAMAKLGTIDDVYVFSSLLALSPDGSQVAYVKQGAAYMYDGGHVTKVAPSDVGALAWGPTAWRVRHKSGS
jgi:hypothetical protein